MKAKTRISKEWTIGLISIVIVAVFVWVGFFLAGRNILTKENTYYAVFENSNGINVSNPVVINGVKVGRVCSIEFMSQDDHRVKIGLAVKKKYPVRKNSKFSLESLGLMSGSGIVIQAGAEGEYLQDGDMVEGDVVPDLLVSLGPMMENLGNILVSLDTLMEKVNKVVDDDAVGDLNMTIASLRASMDNINRLTGRADKLIAENKDKVEDVLDGLSASLKNIEAVSDTLAAADLSGVIASLQSTLRNVDAVVARVNAGEGSVGQLLHNDTLYTNIEAVSKDLDILLRDLKENPKRYVHFSLFGRKDKKDKK